jgi:hypothetical protein
MNYPNIPPEEIERLVLRAMCQGTPQGSLRAQAVELLAHYAWREPIYQVMFNCLASIAAVDPEPLRFALITCLTRKGFPDVELGIFFEPHELTQQDAERLMRWLKTRK